MTVPAEPYIDSVELLQNLAHLGTATAQQGFVRSCAYGGGYGSNDPGIPLDILSEILLGMDSLPF